MATMYMAGFYKPRRFSRGGDIRRAAKLAK
jgi:hypothetical protein